MHRYLRRGLDSLLGKLDGLDEYDVRRPLTPTGTNLLGLVKHVAGVTAGYLGDTFARPFPHPLPWYDEGAEVNADMWATADESRADIESLYRAAADHADATIDALDLGAVGRVGHWPPPDDEVTLHQILVHLTNEVARHAGQADIVRESIDGAVGLWTPGNNVPEQDAAWWAQYRERLEVTAREVAGRP